MELEYDLLKLLDKELLRISVEEFLKFRQTSLYQEQYKYDTLAKLNKQLDVNKVTPENVVEEIKLIQRENPSSGSLASWQGPDNLKKFAEAYPDKATDIIHSLFVESEPIADRLRYFRNVIRDLAPDLAHGLGTPFFGYLFSAFNSQDYTVYRDTNFVGFARLHGFDMPNAVEEKYQFYIQMCREIRSFLKETNVLQYVTLLDVQTLIYCVTEYDHLRFKVAVEYLSQLSNRLEAFKKDPSRFITAISQLDPEYLLEERKLYQGQTKINAIRYEVLDRIIRSGPMDEAELNVIEQQENTKHTTNILQSFSHFTVLFQIYYDAFKDRVRFLLNEIGSILRNRITFFVETEISIATFDFGWRQSFGNSDCGLALYPSGLDNCKDGVQLALDIGPSSIRAGLYMGARLPEDEENYSKELANRFNIGRSLVIEDKKSVDLDVVVATHHSLIDMYYHLNELDKTKRKPVKGQLGKIFLDAEEADWAFDLIASTCEALGVRDMDDPRLVVTLRNDKCAVRVTFCKWLLLGFCAPKDGRGRLQVILPSDTDAAGKSAQKYVFSQTDDDESSINSYIIPLGWSKSLSVGIRDAYFHALETAKDRFNSHAKSPYKRYQDDNIAQAVFDKDHRKKLLNDETIDVPPVRVIPSVPKLEQRFQLDGLYFQDKQRLEQQVTAAIHNNKHIILIGPPGTGKSKLAKAICGYYDVPYKMATANSDWSTFDTIGGYVPDRDSGRLSFKKGIFLDCFKDSKGQPQNTWLILDEVNRADIDKAFGSLFSVLAGDSVTLSFVANSGDNIVVRPQKIGQEDDVVGAHEYVVPTSWRLIATMNTYDKTSLYEMSYAFMRRFAFIPVPLPTNPQVEDLSHYLSSWGIDDKSYVDDIPKLWKVINSYRKIGPALIKDIYRHLIISQGDYASAVIMYVMPQLEGLLDDTLHQFVRQVTSLECIKKDKALVEHFAQDFFQLEIKHE